jgi:hypothetical protein
MERRAEQKQIQVHMNIKGNYVFFEGDIDKTLEKGIDYSTKF